MKTVYVAHTIDDTDILEPEVYFVFANRADAEEFCLSLFEERQYHSFYVAIQDEEYTRLTLHAWGKVPTGDEIADALMRTELYKQYQMGLCRVLEQPVF